MIIALDGPAGVGKSTIAKKLADKLDFYFLNSGNFYRCVTYAVLEKKESPFDKEKVIDIAKKLKISIIEEKIFLNGNYIEDKLHSDEIDEVVAQLSAFKEVREIVNSKIRDIFKNISLVCEGRDMTTVVFPNAEVKIFLDAKPEVRAKRRFEQGVSNLSYSDILDSIKKRDFIDRNKEVGSLKVAPDALYLDSSDLNIDEVFSQILDYIEDRSN